MLSYFSGIILFLMFNLFLNIFIQQVLLLQILCACQHGLRHSFVKHLRYNRRCTKLVLTD